MTRFQPWPRQERGHGHARRIVRRLPNRPLDLCRFTNWFTTTTRPDFASTDGEALTAAKQQEKFDSSASRAQNPSIHLECWSTNFPSHRANAAELLRANFRSFETQVLPEVTRRGMAAAGMKSLGGSARCAPRTITGSEGLRYAIEPSGRTTIVASIRWNSRPQKSPGRGNFQPLKRGRDAELARPQPLLCIRRPLRNYSNDDQIRWQSRTPAASLPDGSKNCLYKILS